MIYASLVGMIVSRAFELLQLSVISIREREETHAPSFLLKMSGFNGDRSSCKFI